MKLVYHQISLSELKKMSEKMYSNLVKDVVDIDKEVMVVDVEMHVDAEQELLEQCSEQKNLWGITIHPNNPQEKWIEYDSIINIRPSQGNRSRGIEQQAIQNKITSIVYKMVVP